MEETQKIYLIIMELISTPILDLCLLKPRLFFDERGSFLESYNQKTLTQLGIETLFVQDNQSVSKKNVLRGLHFQTPPYAQAKLVRVVSGKVWDVAVDLRRNSPTYGAHFGVELSAENNLMFYIPEGFAHGFLALEENTVFSYKCSQFYHKDAEACILWNDKDLNINWKITDPVISEKDAQGISFSNYETVF